MYTVYSENEFMIQLSHQGNIHILAINAPEGKAVDEKLVAAMHEALDSVEAVVGDGPGALVITGSGKAFSVGLNVPVVMQYAPEKKKFLIKHSRSYLAG